MPYSTRRSRVLSTGLSATVEICKALSRVFYLPGSFADMNEVSLKVLRLYRQRCR